MSFNVGNLNKFFNFWSTFCTLLKNLELRLALKAAASAVQPSTKHCQKLLSKLSKQTTSQPVLANLTNLFKNPKYLLVTVKKVNKNLILKTVSTNNSLRFYQM